MNFPHLYYFDRHEFGDWAFYMAPRLLVLADSFRHQWGAPITVRFKWDDNNVAGRLGRHLGESAKSDHNVDRWEEVRGMDCFPSGITTRQDAQRAIDLARSIGFTGIGFYPHWQPSPGLHLGVRTDRKPGSPAMWGAIRPDRDAPQRYVSMCLALEQMDKIMEAGGL